MSIGAKSPTLIQASDTHTAVTTAQEQLEKVSNWWQETESEINLILWMDKSWNARTVSGTSGSTSTECRCTGRRSIQQNAGARKDCLR